LDISQLENIVGKIGFWLKKMSHLFFCPRYQGEAKSAQLIGQAIANNPAFIILRKIEASREIAHTISNAANKVFLESGDLLLNLNEMNLEPNGSK
jgi:prohibitin 2